MLYQEDFKRKAKEVCKGVLGFCPSLQSITLLEAGNNEFDVIDWIIFRVDNAEYKICLADPFMLVYNLYKFVNKYETVLLGSYH